MTENQPNTAPAASGGRRGSRAMWWAVLVVAAGAGILTAHGLVEVALGSGVPTAIGWLYPVITDGLALAAYAATTRLRKTGRVYAWSVVVLAAGLSALAQATYLADGVTQASPELRFTVGAWPAVAAAIAAHLLFLIGTHHTPTTNPHAPEVDSVRPDVQTADVQPAPVSGVQPAAVQTVQVSNPASVQDRPSDQATEAVESARTGAMRQALSPIDRARVTAELHRRRAGAFPSVRELEAAASVSRGTAASAIKELREQTRALHAVNTHDNGPETRAEK